MRTNGNSNNSLIPPRNDLSGVFCLPSQPNIPEGSEYEKKNQHHIDVCVMNQIEQWCGS